MGFKKWINLNNCLILIVFFILVGVQNRALSLSSESQVQWLPLAEEEPFVWDKEAFRFITAGHWTAFADFLWIDSLASDALFHVQAGEHPPAYYGLKLINQLDPKFYEVYSIGALLLTIVRNDNKGALDILLNGANFIENQLDSHSSDFKEVFFSNPSRIYFYIGYVYLFELQEIQKGVQFFNKAASLPGASVPVKRLAKFLETKEGQYQAGIRMYNTLKKRFKDQPKFYNEIVRKQKKLQIGFLLHVLNLKWEKHLGRNPAQIKNPQTKFKKFILSEFKKNEFIQLDDFQLNSDNKIISTVPFASL